MSDKELERCPMEFEDCAAYKRGRCLALENIEYRISCPFYRNRDEQKAIKCDCLEHLVREGRTDLIRKYYLKENA